MRGHHVLDVADLLTEEEDAEAETEERQDDLVRPVDLVRPDSLVRHEGRAECDPVALYVLAADEDEVRP